jgi:PiT family inorganic phosphate transporter
VANGNLGASADVPVWVIISSATAIALGTYVGGWRIIRTMGSRIIKMDPAQGFAAQAVGAAVILSASHAGFPLSTTHVVSGSIVGSGLGTRLAGVRWALAGRIALAWAFTLPMAALVGAGAFFIANRLGGTIGIVIVFALAAAMACAFYLASRRRPVGPHNVNDEWTGSVTPETTTVSAAA